MKRFDWYTWLEANRPEKKEYEKVREIGLFSSKLTPEQREVAVWACNALTIHGNSDAVARYWQ